jgi:hypothetical protein
MLSHSKLSKGFWGETLNMAVHLINRSPSHALDGDIPERVWKGKDISYDHLRVFGCMIFVDDSEPECFEEAMVSEHKNKWLEAMQDEMKSLHKNNTFELVEMPRGKNVLKNK